MPERYVFESGLCIRANHARQPADLLARHRITLVWHRGRAFLLFAEVFLGFADFGALQVANLGGDFVKRGGDHRERGQIVRVAITLDDLRRDRSRLQSQPGANLLFQVRGEVRESTYRARELADAQVFTGGCETDDVTLRLGIPVRDFESECDWFGMDAMRTPDHGRVFELPGAALEHVRQSIQIAG